MAEEQSEYLLGDTSGEIQRLTIQHGIFKHGMKGKMVYAPIDLSKPNLSILDPACADGLWLRDISAQLTPPYRLVGADLMPQFFPKTSPPSIELIQHDFTLPWPSDLHNSFDFVHQRAALAGARSASVEDSVKHLPTLLKPGGWIQLMELDLTATDADGPAVRDFNKLVRVLMEKGGSGDAHCLPGTMTKWLKEAGLVDVREEIVHVAAGKSDEDEKMREVGVKHLVGTAEAIADSVKRMGGSVEGVDLDTVAERYGNELDNEGGEFRFIVAVGRKPE